MEKWFGNSHVLFTVPMVVVFLTIQCVFKLLLVFLSDINKKVYLCKTKVTVRKVENPDYKLSLRTAYLF